MSAAATGAKPYYYVPQPSHWPITGSLALLLMGSGAAFWFNQYPAGPWMVGVGFSILVYMLFGWFGTVIGESEHRLYNQKVDLSFRWSMSWFIFSEVMFFAAFFGALFYIRNLSVPDLGQPGLEAAVAGLRGAVAHQRAVREGPVRADGRDRHPAPQHDHPADVGRDADDRAPRAEGGQPRRAQAVAVPDDRAGLPVRRLPGVRVPPRVHRDEPQAVHRRVRLDVLHADGVPRPARHHRRDDAARDAGPGASRATSTPSTTSRSRRPRGTGTSSTWSGCCCSYSSTGWSDAAADGAAFASPSVRIQRGGRRARRSGAT